MARMMLSWSSIAVVMAEGEDSQMSVDLTMSVKTMAREPVGASALIMELAMVDCEVVLGLEGPLVEGVEVELATGSKGEEAGAGAASWARLEVIDMSRVIIRRPLWSEMV